MTDRDIIEALISRDEKETQRFFFKECRPLFVSIISRIFPYSVDYNEFVNELYLHLMENDAYRLRQFQGRSSIYQWLKIVAIRYFMSKRNNMIDMESKESLLENATLNEIVDEEKATTTRIDTEHIFGLMQNRRYVYVLKRLVLEEAEPKIVAQELKTSIDNLYNIKKRAIAAFTKIALNEAEIYEKESGK